MREIHCPRQPESDRLFLCDGHTIRVRVLEVPGASVYSNPVDRDVVTVQLQSAIAKDDSADVAEDSDGGHLLMSASRHSIHLDGVIRKGVDLGAAIESLVRDEVEKAARKASMRSLALPRLAKLY